MVAIKIAMASTANPKRAGSVFEAVAAVALVGLNVAFAAFFILWGIADGAAINNMEDASGFDAAAMLPNANLMWVAAYVSLVFLLLVDGCAVALILKKRKG